MHEAARRRFGLLPPSCQEVLLVAAMIGAEFPLGTVSRVCRREADQVKRVLDVDAAGLVSAVPGADAIALAAVLAAAA